MTPPRKQLWLSVAVLCAFAAAALLWFMVQARVDGDDLSSSYLGCRVIAAGHTDHLYAHDPKNFAAIGPDDPWQNAADAGGFNAFMHPYVQTPLWAYGLLPLCRHTTWRQFEWVFAVLTVLSFAATIFVVARFWAPALLRPLPLLCVVVLLWFSEPFQYSMALMQTHIFFVLAMIAAVMLADRKRPIVAGVLLALSAAVKITPGVLVLYWLLRRQWRAALSAAAWSVALWAVTRAVAGPQLMATYSATIDRISHVLLLSANNQSLAAVWMDPLSRAARENSFDVSPLPTALRLASSALLALTAAAGGWLDWKRDISLATPTPDSARATFHLATHAPLGALLTMVGATTFAPIEWLHYSIVLLAPLMVIAHIARTTADRQVQAVLWGMTAVIVALNLPPLAADQFADPLSSFALLRGHFYSEILSLITLLELALRHAQSSSQQQAA